MSFDLEIGESVTVPPTGTKRVFADTDGQIKALESTGAEASIGGGDAVGWEAQRLARAVELLGAGAVIHPQAFDLARTKFQNIVGATQDGALSGGFYQFAAGNNAILFGQDDQTLVALPKSESWYAAVEVYLRAAFTNTKQTVPINMIDAGGTEFIQVTANPQVGGAPVNDSASLWAVIGHSSTFSRHDLGLEGTPGQATCPIGSAFWVEVSYSAASGLFKVGLSDTTLLTLSGAQLDNFPTLALRLRASGTDNTAVMSVRSAYLVTR